MKVTKADLVKNLIEVALRHCGDISVAHLDASNFPYRAYAYVDRDGTQMTIGKLIWYLREVCAVIGYEVATLDKIFMSQEELKSIYDSRGNLELKRECALYQLRILGLLCGHTPNTREFKEYDRLPSMSTLNKYFPKRMDFFVRAGLLPFRAHKTGLSPELQDAYRTLLWQRYHALQRSLGRSVTLRDDTQLTQLCVVEFGNWEDASKIMQLHRPRYY